MALFGLFHFCSFVRFVSMLAAVGFFYRCRTRAEECTESRIRSYRAFGGCYFRETHDVFKFDFGTILCGCGRIFWQDQARIQDQPNSQLPTPNQHDDTTRCISLPVSKWRHGGNIHYLFFKPSRTPLLLPLSGKKKSNNEAPQFENDDDDDFVG